MNITQQSQRTIPLERSLGMPEGGPRCLPITLDFTAAVEIVLDYTNMQQRGFFNMVQSVWIDNSTNAAVLTISSPGSGQELKIPPLKQGYLCILVPNPIVMRFASTGGTVVQVTLLNFPVSQILWDFCPCELSNPLPDVITGGGGSS
jgi:hypothetical protein